MFHAGLPWVATAVIATVKLAATAIIALVATAVAIIALVS